MILKYSKKHFLTSKSESMHFKLLMTQDQSITLQISFSYISLILKEVAIIVERKKLKRHKHCKRNVYSRMV